MTGPRLVNEADAARLRETERQRELNRRIERTSKLLGASLVSICLIELPVIGALVIATIIRRGCR